MLQKILPLEKCQEELGSLKAELEEKKSSLKIYQESQLEYVKIKEEIVNSDAMRKKLETKVKKLEEAATKHTQDFRQLKTEKKRLEKELKKAQGKLDGVLKEKCRKVKHAETQSSGEDLATDLDKEKIKLLLEELWMCIDSATGKRENQENDPVLASIQDKAWPEKRRLSVTEETVQMQQKIRRCDGKALPRCASLERAGKRHPAAAVPLAAGPEHLGSEGAGSRAAEAGAVRGDSQTDGAHSSSDLSDHEQKGPAGDVMEILDWARPLPALLSPVQLSPQATQDMLFGEVTASSDEELDDASAAEDVLQEDQAQPQTRNVFSLSEECERHSKVSQCGLHAEISPTLSWNEKNVHISPEMWSKEERGAEAKQAEAAASFADVAMSRDCVQGHSENMDTEKRELTEASACELEAMEEQKGDSEDVHSKEGGSAADFVLHSFKPQNQTEKCSEAEPTEEDVVLMRAVGSEGERETPEVMEAERDRLSGEREAPRPGPVPQDVTGLPPEQCIVHLREDSEEEPDVLAQNEAVQRESENVIQVTEVASDGGEEVNQVTLGEEVAATIQMRGLCAEASNERELPENVLPDFSRSESFCEVECPKDLRVQRGGEGVAVETEAGTGAVEISACSQGPAVQPGGEGLPEEPCVQPVTGEAGRESQPETVHDSRLCLPVSAVEGHRDSLPVDGPGTGAGMERAASSALSEHGEQLRTEDMDTSRPEAIEPALTHNKEEVPETAESSELLHGAEDGQLVDIKVGGCLKGKPQQEAHGSNPLRGESALENVLGLAAAVSMAGAGSSTAQPESYMVASAGRRDEIKQPESLCAAVEHGLSETQNIGVFKSQETEFSVSPEGFRDSEQLARVDAAESVVGESHLTSQAQLAKPPDPFPVTESDKCDEIKGEFKKQSKELVTEACSRSFNWEENVVKTNTWEVVCQPTSDMDFNSDLAFPTGGDLEIGCINTEETDSPVQVGVGLESTVPPDLDFSLQNNDSSIEANVSEKAAFPHMWENKGDEHDVSRSAFNSSSESLGEGVEILPAEQDNTCKELDCPQRELLPKDEVRFPDKKEQPVHEEHQASVKPQILDADSYNKNTFLLRKFDCQESGWEVRTDLSRTDSPTAEGERQELNSFEASGKNAIKRSKNDVDKPEQSNESEEGDCSVKEGRDVRCSECVPVFRREPGAADSALDTGAVVGAGEQGCELHSPIPPEDALSLSHLRADTMVGLDAGCETNSSLGAADGPSGVAGEGCPEDSASGERQPVLVTSENPGGANECLGDSKRAGCISDSEERLLKAELSLESCVMPNAGENKSPVCQVLTASSETGRAAERNSELHTSALALGRSLEENNSDKLQSDVEPGRLSGVDTGVSVLEECNHNGSCTACTTGEGDAGVILHGTSSGGKKVKSNPALSGAEWNCQRVRQPSEPPKPGLEKLRVLESESCVGVGLKERHKMKCKGRETAGILTVSTQTEAQVTHTKLSKRLQRKAEALKAKLAQPVLANADTSVPTKCSSETINKIRREMGPPLPPLLLPLVATPPKAAGTTSPAPSSAGRSPLLSPLDDLISPLRETPIPPLMSPLTATPTVKSALLFSPASPPDPAAGLRIRSSPLKFCTSIPKHALPVPGRLPQLAADSPAPAAPPENSVRILDTMYPELSARARTLNILKGNIQLGRCAFADGQSLPGPVAQIGGFKAIASASTAFVKTGTAKRGGGRDPDRDPQGQQPPVGSASQPEKRPMPMPRSAKRLRMDGEPLRLEPGRGPAVARTESAASDMPEAAGRDAGGAGPVRRVPDADGQRVALALKRIAESCFDLLPVIKGHVHVGNVSKAPIMRDEEKEVVYEFGVKNKHLAESLLHAILGKLKAEKQAAGPHLAQALCRVYVGLCRQLGDAERARLLCYSLLKEGAINEAMQLVVRQSASKEMLACLSAYLNWEESSSLDAGVMVSNLLLEMQSCPKVAFQPSEQYGEDLSEHAWQYIFAVDLLCSHLKWDWTHDNVISKVLWPSMDKWVKKRKGHESAQPIPDSVIALTLRLIGRLGQIGLKEGCLAAVKNISSVIGLFVQHAKEEGVPWAVQLAAVYSLCDLGSSNPEGIVEAVHAWRATAPNNIPSAVMSCLAEVSSLCKMELI
ncbi:little elongation complex subunit 1 isoform X2 [Colius striatus]|uniref:little elongation complex subunit 1 isoform X2 n=1 Tax=Colius striatus TaxID=57412 RepID=UPI002B1E6F12|nr:little elongation complex subunit 1 isoform X2 [Colius striatus]